MKMSLNPNQTHKVLMGSPVKKNPVLKTLAKKKSHINTIKSSLMKTWSVLQRKKSKKAKKLKTISKLLLRRNFPTKKRTKKAQKQIEKKRRISLSKWSFIKLIKRNNSLRILLAARKNATNNSWENSTENLTRKNNHFNSYNIFYNED